MRAFTSFTEDIKICEINPGLHFMDNETSTNLKMTITAMNIKYHLFSPSNHQLKNVEIAIKTFNDNFIVGLLIVGKDFNLQL